MIPYIHANNKKLFYTLTSSQTSGTPTQLPLTLLCIHGLGSSSSFYAPITPHLTSLGHTVLAFDTHGSGLSPYTGVGNTTLSIAEDG
jgi:pimeloyl-ACP methyl ester carboxylesterase